MINIQEKGARVTILGDYNDDKFPYYNPSLAYDKNGSLRISIRSCNFTVKPDGYWHLADGSPHARTKIMYGHINPETLDISFLEELAYDKDCPQEIHNCGLEDARMFLRKDGMHFVGVRVNTPDVSKYQPTICELLLDEKTNKLKHITTFTKPDENRVEKNWIPTDKHTNSFYLNYSPTQVWSKGSVIGNKTNSILHGGTQLIHQEDNTFLSVVHSKTLNSAFGPVYDKYTYVSYFARYDQNGILIELSEPFKLGLGENIEFAGGMVQYKDSMLISFGIRDARMAIVKISKQKILGMLKPYNISNEYNLSPKKALTYIERKKIMAARRQEMLRRKGIIA